MAWSKRYMLPRAMCWYKCTLLIEPKPRGKIQCWCAVLDWLEVQKKMDLRTLLAEHASSEEGWLILQNQQNFMIHQKALYLHSMPKSESEDLLLFIVPKVHWVTALNGCHRDAGHQGHDHTLSRLQECFWWLGMTNQMWPSGPVCIAYNMKAACPRLLCTLLWSPLPWISYMQILPALRQPCSCTSHLKLLMSWYSKTTSQNMYWHMWSPIKQPKPSPKHLYQGCILIFRALARLLSDRGANFMSSVINKMCKILSMKKLQTMPYHPQTNGLVERLHQTIMRMIGKLGEDKKANWPGHLAEIAHTYNATHSALTGYSPHYLMFGQRA